ncbi:APC family permease [Streptomyces sp. NPDC086989]|uniref:APC family permease n=1 Tax=Streptomyces sp. NPDC086989 TaxID=3365764 RepID=UPI003812B7F8
MLAMIMGLATLVGFDSAANLAEEAKDAHRTVPRAIVGSVVAATVLGMLFLITLTVAIKDIPRISAASSPVAAIMRDQLGPVMERVLLVAITFAFFGAGVVAVTACARLVIAMARDGRFPAHRLMRHVTADADPGPGDRPDLRPRGRPDGRAAGRRAAGADHGIDLVGGLFFLVMLMVDRDALETEPGETSEAFRP